jgi:hypothetical protein
MIDRDYREPQGTTFRCRDMNCPKAFGGRFFARASPDAGTEGFGAAVRRWIRRIG